MMIETEDNTKIRILVVDDEPDILEFISYNLKKERFEIFTATDGRTAIKKALGLMPHLILLDVMLPDMDGIEVCKQLRTYPNFDNVIIAFLSARNEDYSQIKGYDAGGDDYIAKPIRPNVLVSKIKSLLRRVTRQFGENKEVIRRKNLIISKETYTLQYADKIIELPRKEFELLYLLASKPNRVFRRREIYDVIWGGEVIVGARTIDVHIRRLRLRTGLDCIKTVKGVGYKYEE